MWRRRAARFLPRKGHYNMGVLGWAFNTITVGWTVFSIVIYCLPPYLPVIPSNMSAPASPPPIHAARTDFLLHHRLYMRHLDSSDNPGATQLEVPCG